MAIHDSLQERWRLLYSRLNQVEARAGEDERWLVLRHLVAYRVAPAVPSRLVLRPGPEGEGELPDEGPPCPVCRVPLSTCEELVACTSCLGLYHRACRHEREPCAGCGAPA